MNPEKVIGKKLSEISGSLKYSEIHDSNLGLEGELPDYYITADDETWEISLGEDYIVKTIFLYLNRGYREFKNISASTTREEVYRQFGKPKKECGESEHPILGKYGAWEKYEFDRYSVHIEHELDHDSVKMITIMSDAHV